MKNKHFAALFVAFIFALTMFLPAIQIQAETEALWMQLKAGPGNGNSHFAENGHENFVLTTETIDGTQDITLDFKVLSQVEATRFRMVTRYVDESKWAYIAFDGKSQNWFYEYKSGTAGGYPGLSGLPRINQGDEVRAEITNTEAGLQVSIQNKTSGQDGKALIDKDNVQNAAFFDVCKSSGRAGFGAAKFGDELTDIALRNVVIGELSPTTPEDYASAFSFYREKEGQVFAKYVKEPEATPTPTPEPGTEPTPDPSIPDGPENEMWIVLTKANTQGGHNYEGPAGPMVVHSPQAITQTGQVLKMTMRPSSNWGVFYSYLDPNNWVYIGWDPTSHWYFQYKLDGAESYPRIPGLEDPKAGSDLDLEISIDRETLTVKANGKTAQVPNSQLINVMNKLGGKGRVAVKTSEGLLKFKDVTLNGETISYKTWKHLVKRSSETLSYEREAYSRVEGNVKTKADAKAVGGAEVRLDRLNTTTDESGHFVFDKVALGEHAIAVSKTGYIAYSGTVNVTESTPALEIQLEAKTAFDESKYDKISSADMEVFIGKSFPSVARYKVGEKIMEANPQELRTFAVNGREVTPSVTVKSTTANSRTYTLKVKDGDLDFDLDVALTADKKTLTWEATDLRNRSTEAIASFDFSKLNLLRASLEAGGQMDFAQKSSDVSNRRDYHYDQNNFAPKKAYRALYGFLSNRELSAGMYSNSELEGDERLRLTTDADAFNLDSALFYYERGDARSGRGRTDLTYPKSDLPLIRIAIAGDENGDAIIDWQDGAIAFRSIQHMPMGTEEMKDLVNYRIAMNFAGQVTNPYLKTADNIKRVYLATDGLPQAVMLKGYGNLGHDSANSEYADISDLQGGVEDFRELIRIAHQYDTEIGIHINAQEMYPEAKSFDPALLQSNLQRGWGWLDQSFVIDKQKELAIASRYKRLVQLYDRINGTSHYSRPWPKAVGVSEGEVTESREAIRREALNNPDNMDFIYLDVWYQDAWETRQIAKEINSLGWRFSTEFATRGEHDSTWQHWATEGPYGGATSKGFNSQIIRFLTNDLRDSQMLNYPSFGGAADNPLLGGFRLKGFEGWQNNNNFDSYLEETFVNNLPTRFLQHYQVIKWENYDEGASPAGNVEKKITLRNASGDIVVVERKDNRRSDDVIERVIQLNGHTVLDEGAYLLPWIDKDGSRKLYHYNVDGGETTWDAPAGFADVLVYELGDQGRMEPVELAAVNGQLTLDAKAKTAYVLVPNNKASRKSVKAYGEGTYLLDPGFNAYTQGEKLSSDSFSGDLGLTAIVRNERGDLQLSMPAADQKVAVRTTISGLTAGQEYLAYVYINNESDSFAGLSVNGVSNRTPRTNLVNYVRSEGQKAGLPMHRVRVNFVADTSTAELELFREAGGGTVYFDDMRVMPNKDTRKQDDGSLLFDFENVPYGYEPFILGPAQGVEDPVTHLAELHEPYSQKWAGKATDDVLEGNWSLKHHGRNSGIIYQTLPHTLYFEPGKVYEISFDYQTASDKGYAIVSGEGDRVNLKDENFLARATETANGSLKVIGAANGTTWIGLYSNPARISDDWAHKDFILDNLRVREDKNTKIALLDRENAYIGEQIKLLTNDEGLKLDIQGPTEGLAFKDGVLTALKAGKYTIEARFSNGQEPATLILNVMDSRQVPLELPDTAGATANTEEPTGEGANNGHAAQAFDGDNATIWHSQWSGNRFTVTESNPAVIELDLGGEQPVGGFYFVQRPSGPNGMIEKYKVELLDAENNVLYENIQEVPGDQRSNGSRVELGFDKTYQASKLRLSVLQGHGGFAAIAELNVTKMERVAKADEITVEEAVTMKPGEGHDIVVSSKANTFVTGLQFESADPAIATVNANGRVEAIKTGNTTVKVSNALGLDKNVKVTVTGADEPTPTPEPSDVPEPTATPQPTNSPVPTGEPEPTLTPGPAVTPVPGKLTQHIEAVSGYVLDGFDCEAYDIYFTDLNGKRVQPGQTMRVSVTLQRISTDDLSVYHLRKDGKPEKINFELKGRTVTFESADFSIYLFANRKSSGATVPSVVSQATTNPQSSGLPSGGEVSMLMLPTLLLLMATAGIVLIVRKRRDNG